LKILKEAGVIESERRGTWIYYRLVASAAERLGGLVRELSGQPQLIPATALRRPATNQPTVAPRPIA
jgi:ArsR family transcriptional regulator